MIRKTGQILGEVELGDSGRMADGQIVLLNPGEELGDINAVAADGPGSVVMVSQ